MQAILPEGVETAVKALTRRKTNLKLAIRRIRKKLEIVIAEKAREAQAHLMKDKCGKCDPCMIKTGCRECSSCLDLPRASMPRQPQDQDLPACLAKSRYCTTWPLEQLAETTSSIVSKITPKFSKASIKEIEDRLKKLSNASSDLSYALKDTG